ncbi:hypothetical protein E8E13_008772 [Curvularia kusanoi]|uniref:Uncharacterized protein n=1 Tax=Curvularia kusanoi TaxID=90978 RepID=A0A9P4WBP8_CURKU|nr:hypothetical protein E8E13_008772 [Curvularia kusanoi]
MSTTPTPTTWTLRLKSHRTTVLLHISPLSSFTAIKASLLSALSDTGLSKTDTSPPIPLPSSPSEIQLGRPIDPLDPSAGFQLGEWETSALSDGDLDVTIDEDDANAKGKGKGKATASSAAGTKAASSKARKNNGTDDSGADCPKSAGLKDGAVLAFRWEGCGDAEEEARTWGVQIASFEDAYGVQNTGDVGGRGEFEG